MTEPEYAANGYHFARISTPSVFREYLLPLADNAMTVHDRKHYEELQNLAELHRTSITCGSYRLG
jgi:hypothetical protein